MSVVSFIFTILLPSSAILQEDLCGTAIVTDRYTNAKSWNRINKMSKQTDRLTKAGREADLVDLINGMAVFQMVFRCHGAGKIHKSSCRPQGW